ncbi:conserved hypothetical protein [Candida dubliniensis CD36]|uniref:Uncharacterized protein n=1 Tax=Candida dubliniensis (strain CD36 / ATCC MYA-646 / CBS 7987 / NCPF 3949 / NRRL Y-17841) TaxID=573826 RepID=B9W9X7_CANDC|nr:conserved hypothetical protein [Candida dubliniensis CD36]CAX45615.1 conserved hypothetical protein [Candida dubliniensis CD36]
MNGNDTSDLSMSSKNKFDLNQFLVYSLNPSSEDNQKFETGSGIAQEKNDTSIIYLSRPNNPVSNRSTYSTQAQDVTSLLDTKNVNTNVYHPSLNFPSKDIDQLSYTTTSSLSQARSNSVSTAITTLTTASSCKSQLSPSIAENVNVDINQFPHNHQFEQIATFQEQTTVCWSSDKIHFLDPILIQDIDNITNNSLTHQEKINAIGADYSHRFIAFASSPPPPQPSQSQQQPSPPPPPPQQSVPQFQDQYEGQLNTETAKQSSDTLTQDDYDLNKSELLNNQTMEIAVEYQTSDHQLIEYASSSSNVLLGYSEIDVEVPENERSSLQPEFDYKRVCPMSRDSDSTCDELESLEKSSNFIYVEECNSSNVPVVTSSSSPTKKYILQNNIPSSPIIGGKRINILENQFLNAKDDNYGDTHDPTMGAEIKFVNEYKATELSKKGSMVSPLESFSSEVSNPNTKTTNPLRKPLKKYVKGNNLMIMPVKFTFVEKRGDYINHIANLKPLVSSTNLELFSFLDSRIANEIYEIGPKILPQPFSQEFLNLANDKFLPLSILTKKLEFQLSKGQVTNYNVKQSHPAKCPNRPNSQGGLGPFRVEPSKKRPSSKLNCSPSNNNNNNSSSSSNIKPELDVKNDRYYSRLNIYELSKILDLHRYSIGLTKLIELNVLEMFGNYCDFQLGYQTWIRDTDKEKRRALIQQLYSYTSTFYPEIDSFKLEVIIRRGSYSLMQTRLRRERRLKKRSNDTHIERIRN